VSELTETAGRPLLVTADNDLLDDLLRLCAAAGVTPEVAGDAGSARRAWGAAGLVVVGEDQAADVAGLDPGRRDGVVVVGHDGDDASLWVRAVALGAEHVLALPAQQDALIELLAGCLDGSTRRALTVSIVGGRGGCGASTLAAALALTGADRGLRTFLVDADPLGGGIDMVLGSEDAVGLRWPDLASASGRLAAPSLREALPSVRALRVLSWDRGDVLTIPAESMRSVLTAAQRAHDLVVVDCPRRLDAAAEEALARSAVVLLLVPAEVRAIAAATRVLGQLRVVAGRICLVARSPGPTGLDAGVVADILDLPLLAHMRPEKGIAQWLDEGLGPMRRRRGALAGCCTDLLDGLAVVGGAHA
jgi:secretion/DNA translocation related CpaE-like protein